MTFVAAKPPEESRQPADQIRPHRVVFVAAPSAANVTVFQGFAAVQPVALVSSPASSVVNQDRAEAKRIRAHRVLTDLRQWAVRIFTREAVMETA